MPSYLVVDGSNKVYAWFGSEGEAIAYAVDLATTRRGVAFLVCKAIVRVTELIILPADGEGPSNGQR